MTFAAFGITGDLMRLKIIPALYGLHGRGELPSDMRVVGISRRQWNDDQLRGYIQEVIPGAEESFLSRFVFLQGDAEDASTFSQLSEKSDGTLLIYLAISPALYKTVFKNIPIGSRVMIEKPLGTSGAMAEELYTQLKSSTSEQHIFLVDHYLAKDWVRNLAIVPVNRDDISHLHIRFFETLGVEKRGVSYDQLGALRDVGQNHVLQIAAHILSPNQRAEALEQLGAPTETMRAQYIGYKDIKGVAADSQTETYFKIQTPLLTLEGGKALSHSSKEVTISLKDGSEVTLSESPNKVPEYEMLISAAIKGEQNLFTSIREVRAQWNFVDPILQAWEKGSPNLDSYEIGTIPAQD